MLAATLYRPIGPLELALIEQTGCTRFPPRKKEQPFFYPVLNQEYAVQIARDWNVPAEGSGYVVRFLVKASFLSQFEVQTVGSSIHQEYWIPRDRLEEFNDNIIGKIEVIASFQ